MRDFKLYRTGDYCQNCDPLYGDPKCMITNRWVDDDKCTMYCENFTDVRGENGIGIRLSFKPDEGYARCYYMLTDYGEVGATIFFGQGYDKEPDDIVFGSRTVRATFKHCYEDACEVILNHEMMHAILRTVEGYTAAAGWDNVEQGDTDYNIHDEEIWRWIESRWSRKTRPLYGHNGILQERKRKEREQ